MRNLGWMICGRECDMLDDDNGAGCLQSDSEVTGHTGRALFWNDGGSGWADFGVCVY